MQGHLDIGISFVYALLGYLVVFIGLVLLMLVVMIMGKPMCFHEFEPSVDAILVTFAQALEPGAGGAGAAICRIIAGLDEPSGLLPMQMPAGMETVEAQFEDVPRDMECYVDADGNKYDFAFGLNWKGVIKDSRVEKYR